MTTKDIEKLMADAQSDLIRSRVKAELAAIEEALAAKKSEYRALKDTLNNSDYTDTSAVDFNNRMKKNTKDILIAGYKVALDSLKAKIAAQAINLEAYKENQLNIMRRIEILKDEIKTLTKQFFGFSGDSQIKISNTIDLKREELSTVEHQLDKTSKQIAKEILAKAEAEAELRTLDMTIKGLAVDEKADHKKPISSAKSIIEASLTALSLAIENLEKRKEILKTDPGLLGKTIIDLLKEGKEVPVDKVEILRLLAIGTSIGDFETSPKKQNYISVPAARSAADLDNSSQLIDAKILSSTKTVEYVKSEIIRMAAAVASYIKVLNEAKLLREKTEALKASETSLPKIAEFRRNIIDTDEKIKEIEQTIIKYSKLLDEQIDFFNGVLFDQIELYLAQGDLAIERSAAELRELSPKENNESIGGTLDGISAKLLLLASHYPDPYTVEEEQYEPSITEDLSGETYPYSSAASIPKAIEEPSRKEPTIEEKPEELSSIPLTTLLSIDPNNGLPSPDLDTSTPVVESTPKTPEAVQEAAEMAEPSAEVEKVPIAQVIEATSMPTKGGLEAVPMSVKEYDPQKELLISPDPKVVKTDKVNVPKMGDLIRRACEALRKFLERVEGMKRI